MLIKAIPFVDKTIGKRPTLFPPVRINKGGGRPKSTPPLIQNQRPPSLLDLKA